MDKFIKYKRYNEMHDEKSLQEFFDKLITEGWEIIYYSETMRSSGMLSSSDDINIHVTAVCGKKQSNVL